MKGGGNPSQGFTIIEVMIVIAVTGLILLSAILLISGRQSQTEFQVGVNEIQSEIQEYIGDVANGFYGNIANYKCQETGNLPPKITAVPGTPTSGSNSDCIFLGKALHFYVSPNISQYTVYPVAGLRCTSYVGGCSPLTQLSDAYPAVVAQAHTFAPWCIVTCHEVTYPNDYQNISLENGISVYKIFSCTGGVCTTMGDTAFFLTDPGPTYTSSLVSGQAALKLYDSSVNMPLNPNDNKIASNLDNYLQTPPPPSGPASVDEVDICFQSGTTKSSALLKIFSGSGQLTTGLTFFGDSIC